MTAHADTPLVRLADLLAGRHSRTGDPLDAGAQLVITEPDGAVVFRAALARTHRIDPDDPRTVWIRPVFGAYQPDPPTGWAFPLGELRRRALTWHHADVDPSGAPLLHLVSGQTARIEPATGPELDQLHHWDDFCLNTLTAGEEALLDTLDADSWHLRFG